jgi:hypothetical protein
VSVFFDDAALDDPAALARIDPDLRALAEAGAAVRRAGELAAGTVAVAGAIPHQRPRAVVAAGPDGRLLRAVLEPSCPVPFVAWPFDGLPGWAGPLDLVVVPAPRGELGAGVVATVAEAERRGCLLLVAAPSSSPLADAGGRDAVHLPVVDTDQLAVASPLLQLLHAWGLGPAVDPAEVADALDAVARRCGPAEPSTANPAKELAMALGDAVPVVWGGSVLAARAARRVAEALRAGSGRAAVAGDADQLVPLVQAAPEHDPFADPFADEAPPVRPALVVLDDGRSAPGPVEAIAEQRGVHVHRVAALEGSELARFASLVATGRYAAAYLACGLGYQADPARELPGQETP